MAWTTPKTWTATVVTVSDLNTHVRDNLNYLLASRPYNLLSSTVQASTSSGSYVDVDVTNLAAVVTPNSSRVLVLSFFLARVDNTASNYAIFRLYGDNGAGASSMVARTYQNAQADMMLAHVYSGLSAGTTYTFTLQYHAGTGTIYVNPQYAVTQYDAFILALEI